MGKGRTPTPLLFTPLDTWANVSPEKGLEAKPAGQRGREGLVGSRVPSQGFTAGNAQWGPGGHESGLKSRMVTGKGEWGHAGWPKTKLR